MHQGACHAQEKTIEDRLPRNEIRIHSSINCKQMASVNVKMVEHIIITARTGMEGKLVMWVITTGKSCLQPCFPLFWILYFQWTRHLERLNCHNVISRNSTAVAHCRVIMPLFYTERMASERQV